LTYFFAKLKIKTMLKSYKSLFKISLISTGNIFNSLIGFVYLTAAAKFLTLEDFGRYSLITSLLVSISKLVDFGTNSLFVAKSISNEDKEISDFFYTLKILLFFITIPISLLALNILKVFDLTTFVLFVIGLIAYTINYTFYAIFQKNEKYVQLILLNTIPAIIKALSAGGLFLGLIKPEINTLFGIFGMSILSSVLLLPFIPNNLRKFKFHVGNSIKLLREALSPGLSLLIYEAWPAINNAIAKLSSGFADVGVFSLASKISNVFSLISLSIFTVLLPKNAERKRDKLRYDFKETILLSVLLLVLSFAAIVVSELFIQIVFGNKFEGSLGLLDMLIFASAVTAIQNFVENYFYVEQQTKYLGGINTTRLLMFLVFALVLIPSLHLKGLALSNLLSAIIGVAITSLVIRKLESNQPAI